MKSALCLAAISCTIIWTAAFVLLLFGAPIPFGTIAEQAALAAICWTLSNKERR